jgi:hypothetical protein
VLHYQIEHPLQEKLLFLADHEVLPDVEPEESISDQ